MNWEEMSYNKFDNKKDRNNEIKNKKEEIKEKNKYYYGTYENIYDDFTFSVEDLFCYIEEEE